MRLGLQISNFSKKQTATRNENFTPNEQLKQGDFQNSTFKRPSISFGSKQPDVIGAFMKQIEKVMIPLTNDGHEKGLNRVIGFSKLKAALYTEVLMPLAQIADGKMRDGLIPSSICFFGPRGAGKTHIAASLGEHCKIKADGHFEHLNLSGDNSRDEQYLQNKFSDAASRFYCSDKKRYSMFLIDSADYVTRRTAKPTIDALAKLTHNCSDRGAILVTTASCLDRVEPKLFNEERGMLVPVSHVKKADIPEMIQHCIKEHGFFAEKSIDYVSIVQRFDENKHQFTPKSIEDRLVESYNDIGDYGGKMGTKDIKSALFDSRLDFDEKAKHQFESDKVYASQLGTLYDD